jgi:hypothetical protein
MAVDSALATHSRQLLGLTLLLLITAHDMHAEEQRIDFTIEG